MHIAGARVLVTGGARRLGRAIALGLGERGAQVAFTYHRSAERGRARRRPRWPPPAPAVTRIAADLADGHAARRAVEQAAARSAASTSSCTPPRAGSSPATRWTSSPRSSPMRSARRSPAASSARRRRARAMGEQRRDRQHHRRRRAGGLAAVRPARRGQGRPRPAHALARARVRPGRARVRRRTRARCCCRTTATRRCEARHAGRTALGRLGSPADVVEAVAYLIEADYVTGEQLVVDGGHTL